VDDDFLPDGADRLEHDIERNIHAVSEREGDLVNASFFIRPHHPDDVFRTAATDMARRLAAKSPIALRLAKQSMNRVEGLALKDAYRLEQDYTDRLMGFEDSREARKAYLEKRDPEWNWR
jgi:enoyl-CoA hydratase/carnithine racemase